jgi:hypothetical protein
MLRTTRIGVKGVPLTVADQGAFFGAQSRHSMLLMLLLFVSKAVHIHSRRLARLMDQSSHVILLVFAGLRLLMIFTALRRLLMFRTSSADGPQYAGLRRPTGHNTQQLSGSICLYVDLCVCVCVRARVCVREQEPRKLIHHFVQVNTHANLTPNQSLSHSNTHTHTHIIEGRPVLCTTRTL